MRDESPIQYLNRHHITGDITRMVLMDHYLECCRQGVFEEREESGVVPPKVRYDPSIRHVACGSRSRRNK